MKKKSLSIFALFFLTLNVFSLDQSDYLKIARYVYEHAQYLKEKNLVTEFNINYNYYLIIRENITDKNKVKDIDNFFDTVKKLYKNSFDVLLLSVNNEPLVYTPPPTPPKSSVNSKSIEIDELFLNAFQKGYDISDFELKGVGPVNLIDIQKLKQKTQ